MKLTKLTMLASLFLSLGLTACNNTPAESSAPESEKSSDSSAPISEKKEDSSSKEDISSSEDEHIPDQAEEYEKMMDSYWKLDQYSDAYTFSTTGNGLSTSIIATNDTPDKQETSVLLSNIYSYQPGQVYYSSWENTIGEDTYFNNKLYQKEESGEYLYEISSNTDSKKKYTLSDGHIDHIGVFSAEENEENFYLTDSDEKEFGSFENLKDYLMLSVEDAAKDYADSSNSIFVMPKYEEYQRTSSITLGTEDNLSYALVEAEIQYNLSEASEAEEAKYAVTESTITVSIHEKMYYTEDAYVKTQLSLSGKLEGGDGTNSFSMAANQAMEVSFATEFDSEDMPVVNPEDTYKEKEMSSGSITLCTPQGMKIVPSYASLNEERPCTDIVANYLGLGVAFDKYYSDKEMTQEITTFTGKTYDQIIYAEPHAAEEGKVLIFDRAWTRENADSEYIPEGSEYYNFFLETIDENGQVDMGSDDAVDFIEMVYTNDTKDNLIDGKKINVDHSKYYTINIYSTLSDSEEE